LTDGEIWAYRDALSVTIQGDFTAKYWPNQKLKIKQADGTKYFKIDLVELEDNNTVLYLDGLGFYILSDSEILEHSYSAEGAPKGFPSCQRVMKFGSNIYQANYYYPGSAYLVFDREADDDDCSIVFRTKGSARAEFGLVTDNDFHFKTVVGEYPNETFIDRLLARASGEVDAFGGILRSYGTSGKLSVIAGNSDLVNGAGLELIYDQDNTQAHIISIEHDNCYRNLNISAQNIGFNIGAISLSQILLLGSDGNATFAGDVSAESFTDRTEGFVGDALSELRKIKIDEQGRIDHTTLPPFAIEPYVIDGEYWPGRNLGNMVSILVSAVCQLSEELEKRAAQIDNLLTSVDQLNKRLSALEAKRK